MSGWPHPTSPYHAGEMRVQEQAGAREPAERIGRRSIRDYLSEQHRDFFSLLSYLFVGTVDAAGRPWASVLTGPAGFAHSPDPKRLTAASLLSPDDPAHAATDRSVAPVPRPSPHRSQLRRPDATAASMWPMRVMPRFYRE